jgi:hypothetical protein
MDKFNEKDLDYKETTVKLKVGKNFKDRRPRSSPNKPNFRNKLSFERMEVSDISFPTSSYKNKSSHNIDVTPVYSILKPERVKNLDLLSNESTWKNQNFTTLGQDSNLRVNEDEFIKKHAERDCTPLRRRRSKSSKKYDIPYREEKQYIQKVERDLETIVKETSLLSGVLLYIFIIL